MKTLSVLLLFLPFLIFCSKQTPKITGIQFENVNFAEALNKAKKQNKLVLVDVFATWCLPCKWLTRVVFLDDTVGQYVNQRFISLKIDGEIGEGQQLKERFKIPGYPTVLILRPDGTEIDRLVGFDGDKKTYLQSIKDYTSGRNTLTDLLLKLKNDEKNIELNFKIANKYNDRGDVENTISYFKNVLELDPENIHNYKNGASYNIAVSEIEMNSNFKSMEEFVSNITDEEYLINGFSALAYYYNKNNEIEKAIHSYERALKKLPANIQIMNSFAWFIFKNEIENSYERGIEVARKAVKLAPEVAGTWDTLAQLYFTNGDIPDAIRAMEKAVILDPDEKSFQNDLVRFKEALTKFN